MPTEWAGSEAGRYEALRRVSRAISSYREAAELFRALADELQNAVRFDYLGLILYHELLNKIEIPVLHVVNAPASLFLRICVQKTPLRGGFITTRNRR